MWTDFEEERPCPALLYEGNTRIFEISPTQNPHSTVEKEAQDRTLCPTRYVNLRGGIVSTRLSLHNGDKEQPVL
jgi:hypothetical protein